MYVPRLNGAKADLCLTSSGRAIPSLGNELVGLGVSQFSYSLLDLLLTMKQRPEIRDRFGRILTSSYHIQWTIHMRVAGDMDAVNDNSLGGCLALQRTRNSGI